MQGSTPGDAILAGLRYSKGMELIFEVRDAEEGGYHAHALGHAIFTEAETWEELRANKPREIAGESITTGNPLLNFTGARTAWRFRIVSNGDGVRL